MKRRERIRKNFRIFWMYFKQFWKTRLIYKTDFTLGFVGQLINLSISLAFLTLIFTQVESLQGWTFNELLFLAGLGGMIMNFHHILMLNVSHLGEDFIVTGKMDRLLVRPLDTLFQVYLDDFADQDLSKLIANTALLVYAAGQIGVSLLSPENLFYLLAALFSGTLFFGSAYLFFASISFWMAKADSIRLLLYRLSDFRRYPIEIFSNPVKLVLMTAMPVAFAAFLPATFLLDKAGYGLWPFTSLLLGPVFYLVAYRFWKYGLSRYSSTGS
ncbi:MAG: ABC transporter permease [Candidatus Nanosalina sp.]